MMMASLRGGKYLLFRFLSASWRSKEKVRAVGFVRDVDGPIPFAEVTGAFRSESSKTGMSTWSESSASDA